MSAASLVALLAVLLADMYGVSALHKAHAPYDRNVKLLGVPELPRGCMYEGRWFKEGAVVSTREACLSCACARGALSCRRRACATLPDPPPKRCHVLHKRGSCCPELHCPDGIKTMEHGASARFEDDDFADIATPATIMHACVEGGSVFTAGSALGSNVACEQCFCLGGARRCVRPRCLPPPAGCRARPAPGACCPQRYYCDHVSTKPPPPKHVHDCIVKGERIMEGERVVAAESEANCTQCFCLRGVVRCQPMACAPPLLGCRPLLRAGQCCPHQYHCDHSQFGLVTPHVSSISENSVASTRNDDRSFHTVQEATTKTMVTSSNTAKNTVAQAATKVESIVTTTKVKRKINDAPPQTTSKKPAENVTTTTTLTTKKDLSATTRKLTVATTEPSTTEALEKTESTEQPDSSVKIMINGTINCTAELSSTSIPLNMSLNDTERIKLESHLRTPTKKIDIEAFTEYPNDIITDRNAIGDFDENETFTINVTSSLRTNNSHSTPGSLLTTTPKLVVPVDLPEALNTSKKTKGDYDYDYTEPTLPPSLPNLKIIPFVAADAVVDDDISSKEPTLTYPILEREDKFPVYYPTTDIKDTKYATRREDVYLPTQYPVFVSEKVEMPKYPHATEGIDLPNVAYPGAHNDLELEQHDYTVSASIGSNIHDVNKSVTKLPTTSTTYALETPSVNLFSPPVETEGGFIPKGPGIIEEYYAVYPSTPPPVPHLTTSMQLDITKECISSDGRHVMEGDSISLACSICTCAWSELHCSPRPCHIPPGCSRRPATSSSVDLCCGELVCEKVNKTTEKPDLLIDIIANGNKEATKNESSIEITEQPTEQTNSPNKSAPVNATSIEKNIDDDLNNKQDVKTATLKEATIMSSFNPSTESMVTAPSTTMPTTVSSPINNDSNYTNNQSQDYEEEEEEDDGFSFGSVLKLLLSDSYETTTLPPKRKHSTVAPRPPVTTKITTTSTAPPTTTKRLSKPVLPFMPMAHHPYTPPKKSYVQNTVNRIDHLVLGEATAIKKTTPRPVPPSFRPIATYKPATKPTTTQRPYVTHRYTETTRTEEGSSQPPVTLDLPRPVGSSALPLPGILKLAGCNIYGRMYRVGRIITELSTPCQECWCTELGVQCNSLKC